MSPYLVCRTYLMSTLDSRRLDPSPRSSRLLVRALPLLVAVAGAGIVFSRRPDAFLHPQFWAEDGTFWYATAYNHGGLSVLFQPHAGYMQFLARCTALISMRFPVYDGPAIFVAVAVAVQIAPAAYIVSNRSSPLIASSRLRLLLAFLYLAIPNSFEVDANLTNAQWHLALLALLVLVAEPPRSVPARVLDVCILVLSGLSGPFVVLLLPVSLVYLAVRRRAWTGLLVLTISVTALVQVVTMLTSQRGSPGALGASISGLFVILGRQIFLGLMIGQWGLVRLSHWSGFNVLSEVIGIVGLGVILAMWLRVRAELRIVGLFGAIVFAASLASPTSTNPIKDWTALSLPGVGGRYWLLPMFAVLAIIVGVLDTWVSLARRSRSADIDSRRRLATYIRRPQVARLTALTSKAVLIVLLIIIVGGGVVHDWRYPPFVNYHFAHYVALLQHARPGQAVTIPTNPPGWSMTLMKRP